MTHFEDSNRYYILPMIMSKFFKKSQLIISKSLYNKSLSNFFVNYNHNLEIKSILKNQSISSINFKIFYYFAVPKHKNTIDGSNPQSKKQKQIPQPKKIQEHPINEVGWKLSTFVNILAIPCIFFYPAYAIKGVMIANSLMQMLGQSDRFQIMIQKLEQKGNMNNSNGSDKKSTRIAQSNKIKQQVNQKNISENETFAKKLDQAKITYTKFLKNVIILSGVSVVTILGDHNALALEISLICINLWIFYNIKFNKFSQGYYFTLISSLAILFIYMTLTRSKQEKSQQTKDLTQNDTNKVEIK